VAALQQRSLADVVTVCIDLIAHSIFLICIYSQEFTAFCLHITNTAHRLTFTCSGDVTGIKLSQQTIGHKQ